MYFYLMLIYISYVSLFYLNNWVVLCDNYIRYYKNKFKWGIISRFLVKNVNVSLYGIVGIGDSICNNLKSVDFCFGMNMILVVSVFFNLFCIVFFIIIYNILNSLFCILIC